MATERVAGVVTIHAPWSDVQDLNALLAILATLNRYYIDAGRVPELPMDGSIRYQREEAGREEWLTLPMIIAGGNGDCEDLAAAWAASYGGTPIVYRTGPNMLHAIVKDGGRFIDPSKMLGMR